MPWTVEDISRFKKGLTQSQKERWVAIANDVLHRCLNNEGSQSECEASAIRQANGVVGNNEIGMLKYYKIQSNSSYEVQERTFNGKKQLIVPVTMMVEGVHNGSEGPLLHLADELGRFPPAWNGMPIVINHPEKDGRPVSANSPDILEDVGVGAVYNTRMEQRRLRAEAWFDEQRLIAVSPEVHQKVKQGELLEVSVGVFSDDQPEQGEWNGEQYVAVARNHRPDHLAILPENQGACSAEDGCGIRANKKGDNMKVNSQIVINALNYSGTTTESWSAPSLEDFGHGSNWDDMTQSQKADVAGHYLIGSGSAENFSELAYPVVTPQGNLSEPALRAVISGRGAALEGFPADTKSAARRRAYRLLNSEFNAELSIPDNLQESKELAGKGFAISKMDINVSQDIDYKQVVENAQRKLDSLDNGDKVHYLQTLYDEYLIYQVNQRNGGEEFYRRQYSVNDSGNIEFVGEPTKVERKVEFVTMQNKRSSILENLKKLNTMKKKQKEQGICPDKVDALIDNSLTKWTKDDRDYLLQLNEETIDKMTPIEQKKEGSGDSSNSTESKEKLSKEDVQEAMKDYAKDVDSFLQLAPKDVGDSIREGVRLNKEKRQNLIKEITDNSDWTENEVSTWNTDKLEKLYKSVVPEGYSLVPSGYTKSEESKKEPSQALKVMTGLDKKQKQEQK